MWRYYYAILEYYKKELAFFWFGINNPPAYLEKVDVTIHEGSNLGAGGVTSFNLTSKGPINIQMIVQGSKARLTDTVIPHEVNHLNWAQYFKMTIPRWIDEGACMTLECLAERKKMQIALIDILEKGRAFPFNRMLNMTKYPVDILPLYAQGTSAIEYLIAIGGGGQKGRFKLIAFLDDYFINAQRIKLEEAWHAALLENYGEYGIKDASDFQLKWVAAVAQGGLKNEFKEFIPKEQPKMVPVILSPVPETAEFTEKIFEEVVEKEPNTEDLYWERVFPVPEDQPISNEMNIILTELERLKEELTKLKKDSERAAAKIKELEEMKKAIEQGSG